VKRVFEISLAVALSGLSALPALAANVMPDLSTVPAGWSTDRYAPASFTNVGTVNGVNNVLGIGISSAQSSANRAGTGQDSGFYDWQGDLTPVTGGPGDDVAVQLYIPSSWASNANGDVQTALWVDTVNQDDFGILGFTNFGTDNQTGNSSATFEAWDSVNGVWDDLSAPVLYGQWNTLDIDDTGTAFDYLINGVLVGSSGLNVPDEALADVFLEAYNYYDPNLGNYYGSVDGTPSFDGISPNDPVNYTADYANVSTPEPATLGLVGFGLAGLALTARRKRRSAE
jgi:hypothetical protein